MPRKGRDEPESGTDARLFTPTRRLIIALSALVPTFFIDHYKAKADPPEPRLSRFDSAIWKTVYDKKRVWGYVNRHSVEPGVSFRIMLATGPSGGKIKGQVEIFRIGYHVEGDRKRVWTSEPVVVEEQEVQETAASLGAGWPVTIDEIDTQQWRSGYYSIDFVDETGWRDSNVTYIVVTNPRKSGDIIFVLGTNTYHAYNSWGGYSLYESAFAGDRAQMLSFDRPSSPAFFDFEYYLLMWLERIAAENSLHVDYASNFDVARDAGFAEKYKLFISGSHNEYWSREEFDSVYRRIFILGKNTLFLGANAAYWQVRYADVNRPSTGIDWGRQLICYKTYDDPIRDRVNEKNGALLVTTMFREGARRPETMLMGSAYQSYFESRSETDPKYPYIVERTDLPFFAGTGYKKGDVIGDLVGYEWDNTDPDGDGKRLWDPQRSQIPPIERSSIVVLFTGSPIDLHGKQCKAEAVYFVSKAGAKVFNAASIRWAWGLAKPGFEREEFKTFNRNLVLDFLKTQRT